MDILSAGRNLQRRALLHGAAGGSNKLRKAGIKEALLRARPGDVVILTGKGSEEVMMGPGGQRIPWNDKQTVLDLVEELGLNE